MVLLSQLLNPDCWQALLAHKSEHGHLPQSEQAAMETFLADEAYRPIVESMMAGEVFPPPRKSAIGKKGSEKKRIVYIYPPDYNRVLKLLGFLLQRRYDHLFADNLYSFRSAHGVREAVRTLTYSKNIGKMWAYKVDISNYFNSVPIERLLPILSAALADAPETCRFLTALLTSHTVLEKGSLIEEDKGIMAGTPISPFLANLYLADLDRKFAEAGVRYARYSDDIILFADSAEALEHHIAALRAHLAEAGLAINPDKEEYSAPGEPWTYLGICYTHGVIDVSPVSVEKLKAKMRRKRRALARWQAKKNVTGVQAAKAFVRAFHRKLFENPVVNDLTWTHWYFPLINTADSLRIIDHYAQSCIRTLATGRNTKSAYNFRYEDIKALGYESLVHHFYAYCEERSEQ